MGDYLRIYLFDHTITSVQTHQCIFYTMVYNLMLCYLFVAQIVPALATGSSFIQLLYPFQISTSVCVCWNFNIPYFLTLQYLSFRLISYIHYPSPRVSYFSKEFWSFLLKTGIRKKDLGSGYALLLWGHFCFQSLSVSKQGIISTRFFCLFSFVLFSWNAYLMPSLPAGTEAGVCSQLPQIRDLRLQEQVVHKSVMGTGVPG